MDLSTIHRQTLARACTTSDFRSTHHSIPDFRSTHHSGPDFRSTHQSSPDFRSTHQSSPAPSTFFRSTSSQADSSVLVSLPGRATLAQSAAQVWETIPSESQWLHGISGNWASWRKVLGNLLTSKPIERGMLVLIFFNLFVILYETNQEARCYPQFSSSNIRHCPTAGVNIPWLDVTNKILLLIYTCEAVALMVVLRKFYFARTFYCLDFTLVILGWVAMIVSSAMPNTSWLRILRLIRIVRIISHANHVPELYMLVKGLAGSMRAMFFGALVLGFLLCCFAIVCVQLVHPINVEVQWDNCERCPRAFESIENSMLTLFQQIVAGDSWGLVSIPVLESNWLGFILVVAQLVIGMGAMNLVLAVVIDRATEAREADRDHRAYLKAKEMQKRRGELSALLRTLDTDASGTIGRDELIYATKCSREFQQLVALAGVHPDEVEEIAECIADKSTGEIEYVALCDVLDAIESGDVRKSVVMLKLGFIDLRKEILAHLSKHGEVLESLANSMGRSNKQTKPAVPSNSLSTCLEPPVVQELPSVSKTHVKDVIFTCKAQINNDAKELQRSCSNFDAFWTQMLHNSYTDCTAALAKLDSEPGMGWRAPSLQRYVSVHRHQYHDLQHRRNRQLRNFMQDLEHDVELLVRHCAAFDSNEDSKDSKEDTEVPVDFHHQLLLSTPRSLTPTTPRNLAEAPLTPE